MKRILIACECSGIVREAFAQELSVLAINDGFSSVEDFLSWDAWDKKYYSGKLIHWTEKRY